MRVLVTGASGIIGANLVRELLADGHEVRAFVREKSDLRSLHDLEIQIAVGDVLQPDSLASAAEGCDLLFHTAAVFSYWSHTSGRTNEDCSRRHDQYRPCRSPDRHQARSAYIFFCGAIGSSDSAKVVREERGEFNETDAYSIAKAKQERAGFAHAEKLGVELVVVVRR